MGYVPVAQVEVRKRRKSVVLLEGAVDQSWLHMYRCDGNNADANLCLDIIFGRCSDGKPGGISGLVVAKRR